MTQCTLESDYWVNQGLSRRVSKFQKKLRDTGRPDAFTNAIINLAGDKSYPASFVYDVWERLPISPFMNYEARDLKRSIPHINQMTLNINWNANTHPPPPNQFPQKSMIMQGHDTGFFRKNDQSGAVPRVDPRILDLLTVDWFGANPPVLHLKWIIPPMGYRLPPQISIPIIDYQHFSQKARGVVMNNTLRSTAEVSDTYNNIRLEQIPDFLFIYLTPEQSDCKLEDPSELMAEITRLDISTDGDSGKLLGMTSMELYSAYVRNALGREMIRTDYDQWRQHHCCVVLRPEDMGLRYSPGIRNPVTLNIRVFFKVHWNRPRMSAILNAVGVQDLRVAQPGNLWSTETGLFNRDININVLCEYRKYRLTLTESGGSRRELLSLPKSDIQSLPQAVPSASVGGLQGVF